MWVENVSRKYRDRPLRVVQLVPTMDRCGAEKQVCLLAAGLPRDRFESHVVLLTRGGPRTAELDAAGVPWTLVGKRGKLDPRGLLRLRRTLRQLAPDVLHCWLFAANSYGRFVGHCLRIPVLIAGERCVDPWKTARHYWIDKALAKVSDAIVTNSSAVRDFYTRRDIPPQLFEIIPNGIPPHSPSALSRSEACRRLGIAPQQYLIAAVGRLAPQKRYRDLIWAAELLGVVHPQAVLVIFGEGPQDDELKRYRDQVTQHHRVRFVGHRSDLADLLPHFDLYWHGSEYEGQSNAVLEAMQAGLPIIASDIPGMRDLIQPDQTGLLVPLGDSAAFARESIRLSESPDEARRLAAAAQLYVERHFSVQQMVDRHAGLYLRLAEQAGAIS